MPITDNRMTRFNITLSEGVKMVMWTLKTQGGEIYVPKIPSYRIMDVAEAIGPNCRKEIIGIRPGEKLHEEMITTADSFTTFDLGKYYAILPADKKIEQYKKGYQGNIKAVKNGFAYSSETNDEFLTVEELRNLIKANIDETFEPV